MTGGPRQQSVMVSAGHALERWGHRAGLETIDVWFLGLRIAALVAGLLWYGLMPAADRGPQVAIVAAFVVFTAGLYVVNALRPGRIPLLYRIALVFDLGIIFALVRSTGGFASDLYLAFILLIALHAFYFGLLTGLATAAAASVLYAFAGDGVLPMPAFALRVTFFSAVGLCMGVLAEQARAQRDALHRQQEQMLRFDRLATVGELAAGLAHELRNPLAGMAGALHVLEEQTLPEPTRRTILGDVQAQITRMNKTLSDLLQQARPAKPERVVSEVNTLLEQSLRFLPRDDITIIRRLESSLPSVYVDPNQVHQAFLNIMVNARQAMPDGGRLTVETATAADIGGGVRVRISDTGGGIPADQVTRIFQPFFTTKTQGTGLGLAIAARVIEQHGGRITVETAPGSGSTFTIALPAVSPHGRSDSRATSPAGR
jgi:signal transduction histidine kinase